MKSNKSIKCDVYTCKYINCDEGTCILDDVKISCSCDKGKCCSKEETKEHIKLYCEELNKYIEKDS